MGLRDDIDKIDAIKALHPVKWAELTLEQQRRLFNHINELTKRDINRAWRKMEEERNEQDSRRQRS